MALIREGKFIATIPEAVTTWPPTWIQFAFIFWTTCCKKFAVVDVFVLCFVLRNHINMKSVKTSKRLLKTEQKALELLHFFIRTRRRVDERTNLESSMTIVSLIQQKSEPLLFKFMFLFLCNVMRKRQQNDVSDTWCSIKLNYEPKSVPGEKWRQKMFNFSCLILQKKITQREFSNEKFMKLEKMGWKIRSGGFR